MKLHSKYQRPVPSTFTQEDFCFCLSIWVYVKQVTPWVEGLGLLVSDKKIFKVLLFISLCKRT